MKLLQWCCRGSARCSQTVCSTRHHTTWKIAASLPQILPVVSTCSPPAAISCLYRNTAVPYSVVGPFLWPDRWPGTRYQTSYEIWLVLLTVFVAIWKLFLSRSTSILQRIRGLAIMRYINLLLTLTSILTVGISCSSLLSVYLFRFRLHLLFVFAAMIMVNKDYQINASVAM